MMEPRALVRPPRTASGPQEPLQSRLPLDFREPTPDSPVNPRLKGELRDRSDHSGDRKRQARPE